MDARVFLFSMLLTANVMHRIHNDRLIYSPAWSIVLVSHKHHVPLVRSVLLLRLAALQIEMLLARINTTLFLDSNYVFRAAFNVTKASRTSSFLAFKTSILHRLFILEVRDARLNQVGQDRLARNLFDPSLIVIQVLRRDIRLLRWHDILNDSLLAQVLETGRRLASV